MTGDDGSVAVIVAVRRKSCRANYDRVKRHLVGVTTEKEPQHPIHVTSQDNVLENLQLLGDPLKNIRRIRHYGRADANVGTLLMYSPSISRAAIRNLVDATESSLETTCIAIMMHIVLMVSWHHC